MMTFSLFTAYAQAEDLNSQKNKADAAVGNAQAGVDAAKKALLQAEALVSDAESKYAAAQSVLAAAQRTANEAVRIQAERAKELYAAEQALIQATIQVQIGQSKIDTQQKAINAYARAIVQDSMPLVSVAMLFNLNTTASLANRVQWNETVLMNNQIDLDNLRKLQLELVAAQDACEEARQLAEEARQAADRQVEIAQAAQQAAEQAQEAAQAALGEVMTMRDMAAKLVSAKGAELTAAQDELKAINAKIAEEKRKESEAANQPKPPSSSSSSPPSPPKPTSAPPPAPPPPGGALTPAQAQSAAYGMLGAYGWGDAQFQCLVNLWNRESGWRWNAENPYSGAYGIPQSLPGSKMASAGADWKTNAVTQIKWGLGYIKNRYTTPCGAWSFFQSNNWY